jgi:RNA-splicing ligase RtcB
MEEVFNGTVRNWASTIDPVALEQVRKAAALDIVPGPVAIMPDAHVGKGATIGSVIPTLGAIIPAAVGVDIGCGMMAVQTCAYAHQLPDDLSALSQRIAKVVPAGVGKGHDGRNAGIYLSARSPQPDKMPWGSTSALVKKALEQFGSLGSGNHFAEVCLDQNDQVWLMLHSGSRGIGNTLASRHIDVAKGVMKDLQVRLEDPDLAWLIEGTPEFEAYIRDLLWSQDYAWGNRIAMMVAFEREFIAFMDQHVVELQGDGLVVHCHHNYTARETHTVGDQEREVWLTRKGAIDASVGKLGIIPGSMATGSFIVEGLGNPLSYNSCSHGAGRRLSRGKAKRELSVESLEKAMDGKSWNSDKALALLDEHPDAYKSIESVMHDQRDLVAIRYELQSVLNYKGV